MHSKCPIEPTAGLPTFQAANKEPMTIKGKVSLTIKVNGLAMPYDFLVVPQLVNTLILGQNFLEQHAVVVDCRHRMVHFHDYLTETPLLDSPSSCPPSVSLIKASTLPLLSEHFSLSTLA